MSAPARILLIADPPAGPRIQAHLAPYGEVDLIRYKAYRGVPFGTEWVLVMNAESRGANIFRDARKAGAVPLSIPTGWSHVQEKLERAGFFKKVHIATVLVSAPLKQNPFSVLAARDAPPEAEPPAPAPEAPAPEPVAEPAAPVTPPSKVEEPVMADPTPSLAGPLSTRPFTDEEREKALVRSREARVAATEAKMKTLRLIFQQNPNATLRDALDALRTMSLDKRAVSALEAARLRNTIRAEMGMPPIEGPHGYTKPGRLTATEKVAETPPPAPPAAAPAPPPPAPEPAGPRLPPDVEAAARLLREALEASPSVMAFTLAYAQGGKARVTWRPVVEASLEV